MKERITILMTPDQKALVAAKANKVGLSLSAYIRKCALEAAVADGGKDAG